MKGFTLLSILSAAVVSVVAASPLLDRRDTENNVLVGYFDGERFLTKNVPLTKQYNTRYFGEEYFRQPVRISYAEIIYGPPTVTCNFESRQGSSQAFATVTRQDPFVPYKGALDDIDVVWCIAPPKQAEGVEGVEGVEGGNWQG